MPKIYTDKNVLDAALERFEIMFKEFDNMYLSVSGGKDSSVMVQLCAMVARKLNKKFSVLYIDLEAQYKHTIDHVEELMECTKDVVENFYWCALPISLRNAVSVIQPKWICWDKNDKHKWVRPMPKHKCVVNEDNYPKEWDWFYRGMEFEDFILYFAEWFNQTHGGKTATGVGIRSNESINRFRTIVSKTKTKYKDYNWTTQVRLGTKPLNVYNFYPLYDWETGDDWGAVAKLNLRYNYIYELMYKNGVSIHEQRLCQPYGDDQRNGLDQFRALEPETWEKVLNRVHGVNFGNIYCRTSLLGNIKSEKPQDMTWEQYAVFLLESLGLYAPELRDHYYNKIKTFLEWHKENEGVIKVPDVADKKLESAKKAASWRRIARAIEKNDFWMSRLSFGQTKSDVEKMFELKKKYKNLIYGKDTNSKPLKRIAEELNKEEE
jgi:predicted phosphoadenosine phosphosulfate sulfurtransferase